MVDDAQDLSLDSDAGPHLVVVKLPELQHSHKALSHLGRTFSVNDCSCSCCGYVNLDCLYYCLIHSFIHSFRPFL